MHAIQTPLGRISVLWSSKRDAARARQLEAEIKLSTLRCKCKERRGDYHTQQRIYIWLHIWIIIVREIYCIGDIISVSATVSCKDRRSPLDCFWISLSPPVSKSHRGRCEQLNRYRLTVHSFGIRTVSMKSWAQLLQGWCFTWRDPFFNEQPLLHKTLEAHSHAFPSIRTRVSSRVLPYSTLIIPEPYMYTL